MRTLNLLPVMSFVIFTLAACSQLTTNKDELAALQLAAEQRADGYVECIKSNSLANAAKNTIDVATAVKLAKDACGAELAAFETAQEKYLGAQMMMTDKPLAAALDAVDERAEKEVGAALLATGTAAVAAAPAAAGNPTAPAAAAPASWSAQQRVYLDCMEDQANKYAALNESASVIADVAHSRCKTHAVAPGTAALTEEGRALVMGAVMDARLGSQESVPGQ
jgi:hypothetical protein